MPYVWFGDDIDLETRYYRSRALQPLLNELNI